MTDGWQAAGTFFWPALAPASMLNGLLAARGLWCGTTRLTLGPGAPPDVSPTTASLSSAIGGRFWRLAYTWIHQNRPQEGELLVGYQPRTDVATVHFTDTFHTGDTVMACTGTVGDDGVVAAEGTFAAPSGPDWGWRIAIEPIGRESLRVVMHAVSPEGEVSLAVEADYAPA